ncbi:MAG TPA: hypothetical protein VMY42_12845 [Thermoguttaceae bacterium]|nr:hypothetical protein [Thermoguttaceae bacterium]
MQFIEMSGGTLAKLVSDDELSPEELGKAGVGEHSVVRINRQGDIEIRRAGSWDVIGGLLGNFEERIQKETGLDWA